MSEPTVDLRGFEASVDRACATLEWQRHCIADLVAVLCAIRSDASVYQWHRVIDQALAKVEGREP